MLKEVPAPKPKAICEMKNWIIAGLIVIAIWVLSFSAILGRQAQRISMLEKPVQGEGL